MNERTLEYALRERFGLTPDEFVKNRRQFGVRQSLETAEAEKLSIADISAAPRRCKQFSFSPRAKRFDLSATKFIQCLYVVQIDLLGVRNVGEDFGHLILTQKMDGWIGRAIGKVA